MTKMNKKGQGAMEYLMTYGWAILVVMIVGIVLWQMGIFTGGGSVNKATGFSTGKVGLIDASIKCRTNGSASFILTNQAGTTISNVVVTPSGSCTGANPAVTIPPGGRATVTLSNCNPRTLGVRWTINTRTTFTENVAGTDITRTQLGQIICTVES